MDSRVYTDILFLLGLFAIFFSIAIFLEKEKIRDYIDEIKGEVISLKYVDPFFLRGYSRKYSVTYKDKNGNIVNAKCLGTIWGSVNLYSSTVIAK
jgi:hypothetical protein